MQEYLDNAWVSISGQVILGHNFFFLANPVTEEASKLLVEYPNVIRHSVTILRLRTPEIVHNNFSFLNFMETGHNSSPGFFSFLVMCLV